RAERNGGGGAGGGGNLGGSGLDTGISTPAALLGEAGATGAPAPQDAPGSAYSSGGGAGAATAGGSDPFGRRTASVDGGNTGDVAFGNSGDFGGKGKDGNAMGSEDPDDYFTRIGLGESLFKKVEKKYNEKAGSWALIEANAVLKSFK
ncbi:MAG: hypothetical protein ACXWP5_10220, partial [Bdellovibrionota bacterium]